MNLDRERLSRGLIMSDRYQSTWRTTIMSDHYQSTYVARGGAPGAKVAPAADSTTAVGEVASVASDAYCVGRETSSIG